FSAPVKTFLNCTMPALVNIRVGSLRGTSGLDGNTVWPSPSKKSRKPFRISLTDACLLDVMSGVGGPCRSPEGAPRTAPYTGSGKELNPACHKAKPVPTRASDIEWVATPGKRPRAAL